MDKNSLITYKNKYYKYKNKYLEQKGGTSDSRIEDNRQGNNYFSFARVHPRTDIVLQLGQKYVFQRLLNDDRELDRIQYNENIYIPVEVNFAFEELEYLGQKKIRMMDRAGNINTFTKRRDKIENIPIVENIQDNIVFENPRDNNIDLVNDIALIFEQVHAFKRLNGTGEVLMLNDNQVSDQICL